MVVEIWMLFYWFIGNIDKGVELFELCGICKGVEVVDGVVFFEFKVDKILMVSGKVCFVVVGYLGCCYVVWIVVFVV